MQILIRLKNATVVRNEVGDTLELPEGTQVLYRRTETEHRITYHDRYLKKWTQTKPIDKGDKC